MADKPTKIATIVSMALAMHRKNGVGLVVVDYINLVIPSGKHENRQTELASVSLGLQRLSKEGIVVVALAQLNRNAAETRPRMNDLKESGALEQHADLLFLLHRTDPERIWSGQTEIRTDVIVAKNRDGALSTYNMMFITRSLAFEVATDEPTAVSADTAPPTKCEVCKFRTVGAGGYKCDHCAAKAEREAAPGYQTNLLDVQGDDTPY